MNGKNNRIKISLVIPALNEQEYLSQCLESVMAQDFEFFETIVVDNGSTDNTAKIAKSFNVRYVYESRPGLGYARQTGLDNSRGEIVLNIDADCIIPSDYLHRIHDFFQENPQVAALSNPFNYFDGSWYLKTFMSLFFFVFNIFTKLNLFRFLFGGSFAVRKEILLQCGGFNTEVKFWGEDTNTTKRVGKIGKIYFLSDLLLLTSARRFNKFGVIKTCNNYVKQFLLVYLNENQADFIKANSIGFGQKLILTVIGILFFFYLSLPNSFIHDSTYASFVHRAKSTKMVHIIQQGANKSDYAIDRFQSHPADTIFFTGFLMALSLLIYFIANPKSKFFGDTINRLSFDQTKKVALTFDDGPNGKYTEKILEILKTEDISATFFLIGHNVKKYPSLTKKIANSGHVIGNHSYDHGWFLPFFSSASIKSELEKTSQIIQKTTGVKPTLFRPPHGLRTPRLMKIANQQGMSTVVWDDMTTDYLKISKAKKISRNILKKVKPGTIIVLHDGINLDHETINRDQTIEALKIIINELKKQHYQFVTLDQSGVLLITETSIVSSS